MDSLRIAPAEGTALQAPCCRCGLTGRVWDQIAAKPYCPSCQELLAMGEGPPLIEPTEKHRCAVCNKLGTVCFTTVPLQGSGPLAIDLCPEHLRGLVGRWLGPYAYHQLRRQLVRLEVQPEDVFLLHGAFYDEQGRALQPAIDMS